VHLLAVPAVTLPPNNKTRIELSIFPKLVLKDGSTVLSAAAMTLGMQSSSNRFCSRRE
jgi:hypothetical protein